MKYFSTGFFLKGNVEVKDIINECLSWVSTSPFTSFVPASLDMKRGLDEFDIEVGDERIELINFSDDSIMMSCFRYSKISGAHKWVTDVAVNYYFSEGKTWVQVESSVVTQQAVHKAPVTKTPLIVLRLLDKFSGGRDDVFKVGIEPVLLDGSEHSLGFACDIINGRHKNRLPVVYVSSKYFFKEHPHNVIPGRLARKLSGLAHVVVEPEGHLFSNKLKHEVNNKNSYGGSVGIYWPGGQSISIHKRGSLSAAEFEKEIFKEIITAMTSLAPLRKNGWSEIVSSKNRKAIQVLKDNGSQSSELASLYEEENESLQDEVKELNQKIASYEARIRVLMERTSMQGGVFLKIGNEYELFEGEVLEIIMSSIRKVLPTNYEGGRYHDVLSSISSANPCSTNLLERDKKLKQALVGYTKMTPKLRGVLNDVGFSISEEGKHYKITYHGDPRYTYILPKTGSDYRGALNAYSDISKKVFS